MIVYNALEFCEILSGICSHERFLRERRVWPREEGGHKKEMEGNSSKFRWGFVRLFCVLFGGRQAVALLVSNDKL